MVADSQEPKGGFWAGSPDEVREEGPPQLSSIGLAVLRSYSRRKNIGKNCGPDCSIWRGQQGRMGRGG